MAIDAEQLDSRTRVVTPENIAFEYRSAGPFSRVGAYLMDVGVQLLIVVVTIIFFWLMLLAILASIYSGGGASSFSSFLGNLGVFSIFVLWFLMQWFYGSFFEIWWNGQTPGKRALGLRVLQADGRPINASQAILRNLIRLLDAYPLLPLPQVMLQVIVYFSPLAAGSQLIALVSMSCTRKFQRLGDLASGTMVIAEDQSRVVKLEPISDPAVAALQEAIPANFAISRSLSKALAHYIGRRRYFGPARRQEIARHVGLVLIEQLNLPANTDCDALLCALYNRAFRAGAAMDESLRQPEGSTVATISGVPLATSAPPSPTPTEANGGETNTENPQPVATS
ncbi:MAG: RDD family protein [Planctomycetota bacterium]